ncbi:invasion protein IalB [Mesorhizobium robiniae]|uniref:Invasion protein IalB n=2 Tax=Mesorhizobium robiniae TaxID=559315 RepID=A0ABV2GUG3_9HYPH
MMQIFRVAGFGALGVLATLTILPLSAALAQSAPTPAAPKTETFGKWSTTVDEIDTGEDVRKTCVASTAFLDASGTSGTLTLAISNGDALPPNGYPTLIIAMRNKDLPTGENIPAVFGDSNGKVKATVNALAGGKWMLNNKTEVSLALLRAMRRAGALDIVFADKPVATVSMDGFTKAYRSLGLSCGFPTGDVAP